LIPLGITLVSAGSHTEPGGYTGAGQQNLHVTERGRVRALAGNASEWAPDEIPAGATKQFEIADERSPEEIAGLIRSLGCEPVWKDWDAALLA
jgi:2-iminoacetate synthase